MIRIGNIKIHIQEDNIKNWKKKIAKQLKIQPNDIISIKIAKKSIDARKKPEIYFVYSFDINIKDENKIIKKFPNLLFEEKKELEIKNFGGKKRPIIIGAGPSGLFCALILARANAKPIIIEKGEAVEDRSNTVKKFFTQNILNTESNVQFGEGGAGTFSDGKLNSSVKDNRNRFVLKTFVEAGADKEILYNNKPHIGTDILMDVIKNIRKEIIERGGEIFFNTKMIDFIHDDEITVITNKNDFKTDRLVLALGNSARTEFKLLKRKGIVLTPKAFAVGYRVSHSQEMINRVNYGNKFCEMLGASDYKLTYTTKNKIPVYSFCMCPGGYIVNSSSEIGQLVVNGMSYSKRNSPNANSAIIMGVNFDTIEEAINYQIEIEKKAYLCGKASIPTMLYGDYKKNKPSESFKSILPVFKGSYKLCNIRGILDKRLEEAFIEGMEAFSQKIKNFNMDDTIIAAIESRTSSPVRIIRNEKFQTNLANIYPIGEGAGYAGGIMSAAIDGIKVAQSILEEK